MQLAILGHLNGPLLRVGGEGRCQRDRSQVGFGSCSLSLILSAVSLMLFELRLFLHALYPIGALCV